MNDRWIDCKESYDDRIKKMVKYIEPLSSVLDLGCGQMALKKQLPYKCTYTPCDLVTRSKDTIVCNLNVEADKIKEHYDYIVCSGILEYLNDIAKTIEIIAPCTNNFIISYACIEQFPCDRGHHDWRNALTIQELIEIFKDEGFEVRIRDSWNLQTILYLERVQ